MLLRGLAYIGSKFILFIYYIYLFYCIIKHCCGFQPLKTEWGSMFHETCLPHETSYSSYLSMSVFLKWPIPHILWNSKSILIFNNKGIYVQHLTSDIRPVESSVHSPKFLTKCLNHFQVRNLLLSGEILVHFGPVSFSLLVIETHLIFCPHVSLLHHFWSFPPCFHLYCSTRCLQQGCLSTCSHLFLRSDHTSRTVNMLIWHCQDLFIQSNGQQALLFPPLQTERLNACRLLFIAVGNNWLSLCGRTKINTINHPMACCFSLPQ